MGCDGDFDVIFEEFWDEVDEVGCDFGEEFWEFFEGHAATRVGLDAALVHVEGDDFDAFFVECLDDVGVEGV